jgi:AcrR family transcriptional regulator
LASPDVRPVPERLLAAALKLVETHGLQGLTQARVAEAAGLRQSHLTYYFPTRKDLLKGIVQAIHAGMLEDMTTVVPTQGPGADSLEEVREFFAARLCEPLMARLMMALNGAADEDPSLREWLTDFDDDLIGRLRGIFTQLGLRPSEDELALLHASFVGAAILGAQSGTEVGAERTARLVRLAFDRAVEAASHPSGGAGRVARRTKAKP